MEFGNTMLGSILDVSPDVYGDEMELVLNEITMVSGTSNSLWNATTANSTGAGQTYGCKEYLTVAHPQVFIIILLLIFIILLILAISLWDTIRNINHPHRLVVQSLPIDYFDWQLAMAKMLVNKNNIDERRLPRCEYSLNEATIECKIADSENEPQCIYVWDSDYKMIRPKVDAVVTPAK
jgi:hypothetical protein